jgi:23S rRNA pseudouridine1911/1915/1917 synthase
VRWPAVKPSEALPEAIPVDVLHEDDDIIVINKAEDLVVHPAAGHEDGTLVNALLHHCRGRLSGVGGVERPGIVHRLDLGTSGCLVAAKSDAAHRFLQEQFATRKVEKIYQAIVCGAVVAAQGEIRAPIARHPSHRKRMAVTQPGKPGRASWTSYKVLERLKEATFVEAVLHTGRTHQVRVHFLHIGHPLVGDATYGAAANARLVERTGVCAARQMLHARRLAFRHPRSGKWVDFDAPLPADFRATLEQLRSSAEGIRI